MSKKKKSLNTPSFFCAEQNPRSIFANDIEGIMVTWYVDNMITTSIVIHCLQNLLNIKDACRKSQFLTSKAYSLWKESCQFA